MRDQNIEDQCTVDLAIASVFQNEAPYLKEWIEFHRMLGAQRFVLMNDRSSDNFEAVFQPYIDSGTVVLIHRPCPEPLQGKGWTQYQLAITTALLDQMRGVTRWLALVDVDEFI